MVDDKLDRLEAIINAIGAEGAAIIGGNPDGLYIYAESNGGSVYGAVFKDEGKAVRYFDATNELFDLIRDAWEVENTDVKKRWTVIEYEVIGKKFDVKFAYPEELDPNDFSADRRRAALKKRYGDKPVIYPPMPEIMKGAPDVSAP